MKSLIKLFLLLFPKHPKVILNKGFKLNIKPSKIDKRDNDFQQSVGISPEYSDVSYREFVPFIENQSSAPSCGSHVAEMGMNVLERKNNPLWYTDLSQAHHFWWVRQEGYENTFPELTGQTG